MIFIFVGGCSRSGTSLVQKILSSHSKIAGGPEFDHTRDIFSLYQKMLSGEHRKRQAFFYSEDDLKCAFKKFYESFFKDLFNSKKDAIYVSEKTPVNIDVADVLLDIFSEAKFVCVVRDGRDVLVSHQDVKKRSKSKHYNGVKWTSFGISNLWNFTINKQFKLLESSGLSSRIFVIKYEKLVRDPAKELSRLFEFLNLYLEEHLLYPEKIRKVDTEKLVDDIWYTQEMYNQKYNAAKIERWKTELGFLDKIISNTLMSTNLRLAKYDVDSKYIFVRTILINGLTKRIFRYLDRILMMRLSRNLFS